MTVRTNNPTRVPGFPKIPATAGPELVRYLEALQEAIDIRLGRRGDQRDRAVTLRELIDSGLAYDLKANPFDPNNIGATNIGFAPLNEVPNLDTPPQPTGFNVSGAYSQVNMTWDFPLYNNHAHTEIWRHSSDSIGDAQLIGIQVGRGFVDPIGSGQTRYYWIRHVSQTDVKGPFNATAGTVGQTALDVDFLLNVLSGSIAEDDLTQALQDKVGDLDVLSADVSTAGSVAYQLAIEAAARASGDSSEASARASAVTSLENAVFNDLSGVADWVSSTAYVTGDRVVYDRKIYRAVANSTNVTPGTNTSYWSLDSLAKTSAVDALTSVITSDYATIASVTALSTDVYEGAFDANPWNASTSYAIGAKAVHEGTLYVATAASTDVEPPNSSYWDVSTLINQQSLTAQINTATSGLATQTALTQLQTNAFNNITGLSNWSSSTSYAVGDRVVYTDSNDATKVYRALLSNTNAVPVSNLSGSTPKWAIDPSASALALNELSTTLTTDYATAETTNALIAQKEDSGTAASLISDSEATAASTYATISTVDAQYAAIFEEMTGVDDWNSGTTYSTGDRVIHSTGTPAIKRLYRALQGGSNHNPATQTAYWALDTLAYAAALSSLDLQVNANGTGLVDKVDGVQLRLNDIDGDSSNITMEQRFTAQSTDIGTLESRYTVKIDADGHVAGFGLASATNAADGNTSQFFINADRFAIVPEQVSSATASWAASTSYAFGAQVVYSGNLYVCQSSHTSNSSRVPGTSGGDPYWVRGDLSPFVVQRTATTDPDGTVIPPGVYMNAAAIKTASITSAMIGSVNADRIDTGVLDVANLITANAIDASKLNIDGSSITSVVVNGVPTLQLGSVNVPKLTGNSISANRMSGTTVYANRLLGDVNKLYPFRQTTSIGVAGNASSSSFAGERTIIEVQIPSTTHLSEGHKPFASITGYLDSNASKTYQFKLYMKDNSGGSGSVGTPSSVAGPYGSTYLMYFAGDVTASVSVGATLTGTSRSHTCTGVQYLSSTNQTQVSYTLGTGSAFTTSTAVTASAAGSYTVVGEQRIKATTDLYTQFAISGSLSAATRGTVDVKFTVTRYGSSFNSDTSTGVDYINEVSGIVMGIS